MHSQKTEILPGNPVGIARAANLLAQGQLVAFPTETVYGLGADARNDIAVARIFKAKDRPVFNPLIVHVANLAAAQDIAVFNDLALRLAAAFWPGPLTLVLPLKQNSGIAPLVSAGLPTVAIRVPQHPLAQSLLGRAAVPIAAPSANLSGKVSPTRASHVIAGLGGRIAAVLDGGDCPVGLESTIIGFDSGIGFDPGIGIDPGPTLLRPGGLPTEAIEQCIQHDLKALAQPQPSAVNAPGQLVSHYAPSAPMRLNVTRIASGESLLGFGPVRCDLNLSASGDLTEAAANLFSHLHQLDAGNATKIAVSPIPDHGLGRAINDRLKRGAALTAQD